MAKFKTRARAVDMLGRQQIAGVPNAISELFKNAHDAYADHVEVDFFRSDGLFVLRDDGLGMTLEDFENRWLTIGTESKVSSLKGIDKPPIDPEKPLRSLTGEKGIGRLAIAVIGPQVLVLTRAKDDKLIAAFLHWGLFTIPGVNLEQIEIPLRSFAGGTLPTNEEVQEMVDAVSKNVLNLQKGGFLDTETANHISQELERFNFNLEDMAKYLGKPSLLENGHGTHFYVLPARNELGEDLDLLQDKDSESRIRKLLLGFGNTMIPEHETPPISTVFRYWRTDDIEPIDIIDVGEFFTPTEFASADHIIQGQFDAFGQFVGNVSVYGNVALDHVVPWPKGQNKPIACGPFRINVAYVPGVLRQSKLPPEEWARLNAKVMSIGGLYIYKDGIRILPYGDNDVDFLDIEKRRSKGLSYYFFSYRRMFGTIELTQSNNKSLAEKAGREGFQDNRAYRDFKNVLENFFIQLAADFFRPEGQHADAFNETRSDLLRAKSARELQEKDNQRKSRKFQVELDNFFEKSNSSEIQEEVDAIIKSCLKDIESASQKQDEISLLNAELDANRKFVELRNKYKVARPDGVGLNSGLKRDWNAYLLEFDRVERDIFSKGQVRIQSIVTEASNRLKFALDKKQRIDLLLNEIVIDSRNRLANEIQSAEGIFTNLLKQFNALAQQMVNQLNGTATNIERELINFEVENKSPEDIEKFRSQWESRLSKETQTYIEVIKHIHAQLANINWYRDENGFLIGNAEIMAALEDEVLALREQVDADVELAQLGMALNIINHEFSNTIQAIRGGIRRLKTWTNENPQLKPIYQEISDSFTYLDGYLNLFTPLNRRLYRTAVNITGKSIASYLKNLFKERMSQDEITLVVTARFLEMSIIGYPSTFYPVFVNLVDNAVFWLKDRPLPREVKLDVKDDAFIVSDNGPGIPKRDQSAVFELGFTRKAGGRGMGLYISREVLKKAGFDLQLDTLNSKTGSTFIIKPIDS